MNEPVKKRQRNTSELPIGTAIEKLVTLRAERWAAHKAVDVDYDERDQKVLYRVPEEFRAHVMSKASNTAAVAPNQVPTPTATEERPAWLDAPAPEAPAAVERDTETGASRRVGARRT